MAIKYFKNVNTVQELKKVFVSLLKKHHPDNGGDVEICKVINAEYEYLVKRLPKATAEGKKETPEEKKAAVDLDREIRDLVYKIIHMQGINIEIVGTWVWVDGNTFPWKEELKAAGFRWSKARQKWHACPYGEGNYYKGTKKSFNTLRKIYGSDIVDTKTAPSIAMA